MLVALGALVASGCGDGSGKGSSSNGESRTSPNTTNDGTDTAQKPRPTKSLGGQDPAEDDTLLLYYPDDPDTLNVITSNDNVSTTFQRQVYEFLASRSYQNPDEFEPGLAESWEFDEPTLTFTLHLRKGVKWHPMKLPDGTPLPETEFTSNDVKFSFDAMLNENVEAAAIRSYFVDPEAKEASKRSKIKLTVVDKYTVKIKWLQPYFLAKAFTLNGIQIMPRHVYSVDKNGEPVSFDFRNSKEFADLFNNHWANTTMCGTGPLIFKQWKKDEEVTLERNPDYWGNPFYFKKVVYRNITNPQTALQKILQGELDWASISQKDLYVQSKQHERVVAGKVLLKEYRYPGYRYLGYNQSRALFQDKRVRWAISHAVPVDKIIEKVYFGLADRLTGPFLPGSTGNDDSLKPIQYDLERAKQLLDEAGWKDSDENGVRDKFVAGKKVDAVFDLMIYSDSPQFRTIAEIVSENCRKIGIDVRITPTKWALMLQKLRKKEFDVSLLGWVLDWKGDPFQLWHGSQADLPESSNSIGYKSPEADKIIEELRVTMDEKKQVELMRKFHRVIYDDQPYTFLFMEKATAGLHERIENVRFYKIRPSVDVREWHARHAR